MRADVSLVRFAVIARMFPKKIGPDDRASGPERKVFHRLESELDDSWWVYFSAGLIVQDRADGARHDEADFVLTHPEYGIVVLEVKGGVRTKDGVWKRIESDGSWKGTEDPGAQTTRHYFKVLKKIEAKFGWNRGEIRGAKALAITDITLGELDLAPDLPHELVIDRSELREDLEGTVGQVVDYFRGTHDKSRRLGEAGMLELKALFAPTIELEPRLVDDFADEEIEFKRLTSQQSGVVRNMPSKPRAVVYGCAGSGKTMIGVELAAEQAALGRSVLYTCYNFALAQDISARKLALGCTVVNFHQLCRDAADRAGLAIPDPPVTPSRNDVAGADADEVEQAYGEAKQAHQEAKKVYFDETLADLLLKAYAKLGPEFDVIVIDESQDFFDLWFDILMSTLRDGDDSRVWLLRDDGQSVYDQAFAVPDDFFPYELTSNCRNTQAIHREVIKFYPGDMELAVRGPKGRPVEFVYGDDQAALVNEAVRRVTVGKGVPTADIVVLSFNKAETSRVARKPKGFKYVKGPTISPDEVRFSSIRGFKGLEARVVIVCELDRIEHGRAIEQTYVALSRARNHLIVVGPRPDSGGVVDETS